MWAASHPAGFRLGMLAGKRLWEGYSLGTASSGKRATAMGEVSEE